LRQRFLCVYNGHMRTNRYPDICVKCHNNVDAHAGVLYRDWPFTSKQQWKVRCADGTECAMTAAAAEQAKKDAARERKMQSPKYVRMVALAEGYNVPAEFTVTGEGSNVVRVVRSLRAGEWWVEWLMVESNGVESVFHDDVYCTEAEAVGSTVTMLRESALDEDEYRVVLDGFRCKAMQ
jgi:hypothetical protein